MNRNQAVDLQDSKVDVKVVLSGLWVSTLVIFAYVDIFGFWRDDVINGALNGEVPGPGFEINQLFLALTTVYILIPSLMVAVSLVAPARVNRIAQLVVSLAYIMTIVGSAIGESWVYYLLGSAVEVILLLGVAKVAWSWPRTLAA